jgi:hypothetical protein
MAVAVVTLALLAAIAVVFRRDRPNYALYDSERAWGDEHPTHGDWHVQAWILALLASTAIFGFILGVFVYITSFLRIKASVRWVWCIVGALGAVALLSTLGHFLVLRYPEGLLQYWFELPWPLE